MSDWIPVSEQLPETGKDVLVCVGRASSRQPIYRHIEIGYKLESGGWLLSGEWWYEEGADEITHWQPLPDLPGGV